MEKTRMKIGCVALRRDVFSAEAAQTEKNEILCALRRLNFCDIVDIDDINEEGLLFDERDLAAVLEKLKAEEVDGVFFPHCNFGCEHLAAKVGKALGKPVLLWGPRDGSPLEDGTRTRDSQCGLFATGKVLRRFNVPFTYIVNSKVTDSVFTTGFQNFIAVCAVIKAFRGIRILQVSTRPDAFWTMICNEGELLERFGVQVYPITLIDLEKEVEAIKAAGEDEDFKEALCALENKMDCSGIDEAAKINLAALKAALGRFVKKFHCTAVAIQCWFSMQKMLGIMPCVANGLLTDEGIPTVCETDLHGAIGSIMLQEAALRTSAIFFADMTIRHPENDNAELLWHCGNFPPSLAKTGAAPYVDCSFIVDSRCPGIGVWEIRGGDITVCRFDGDHGEYKLLVGEGKGVEGPKNKGTYVWFEVNDWPLWEEKLVTGPYVHHCTGVHGKYAHILYEACKYIPGLSPDPVEPMEAELQKRLRNGNCI